MKKITAILKECEFVDKLFGLREKQIKRALDAAKDDIERQCTEAEIEYENLCKKLGGKDDSDYKSLFNQMIEQRAILRSADETRAILAEIEADLESDVEIEEKKEKCCKK